MRSERGLALVFVLMIFGAVLIAGGCSKDKGTNPPATGGSTGDNFDSGNLGGTPFTHTFNTAGSFPYHCKNHSGMVGTVTVDDNAANTTASVTVGAGGGNVFSPTPITVKTGGTVTWTRSTGVHTVTRP